MRGNVDELTTVAAESSIRNAGDDRSDIYRMVSPFAPFRRWLVRRSDECQPVLDQGNLPVSSSAASLDNRSQVVGMSCCFVPITALPATSTTAEIPVPVSAGCS